MSDLKVEPKTEKKKLLYLEIMRIVAIFFVIFNHTGEEGFLLYSLRPEGSVQFWIYLCLSVFCKFSVPLYFAISGALLLGREPEPLKKLWKRVFRILLVLILISLFYYCVTITKQGTGFDITYFSGAIYTVYLKYHLGFLYAYMIFLITLPFLQALVKSLDDKFFYYMMGIALFYDGLLPMIEYILYQGNRSVTDTWKASWLVSKVVLYPCVGYFLQHRFVITRKKLQIITVLNVLGIAACSFMTFFKGKMGGGYISESFHDNFVLLNCIWVFCVIKYLFADRTFSPRMEKMISSLGACTFGIYLIHVFFLEHPISEGVMAALTGMGWNHMLAVVIQCVLVFGNSYIVTFILKKIPIMRELL